MRYFINSSRYIVLEQWYRTTVSMVDDLDNWDDNNDVMQALIVMWMGWVTKDVDEIAGITGIDYQYVLSCKARALANRIWGDGRIMYASKWISKDDSAKALMEADFAIILDSLVIAGHVARDGDRYQHLPETERQNEVLNICVGDVVGSVTGKGPSSMVVGIKTSDGRYYIRTMSKRGKISPWKSINGLVVRAPKQQQQIDFYVVREIDNYDPATGPLSWCLQPKL